MKGKLMLYAILLVVVLIGGLGILFITNRANGQPDTPITTISGTPETDPETVEYNYEVGNEIGMSDTIVKLEFDTGRVDVVREKNPVTIRILEPLVSNVLSISRNDRMNKISYYLNFDLDDDFEIISATANFVIDVCTAKQPASYIHPEKCNGGPETRTLCGDTENNKCNILWDGAVPYVEESNLERIDSIFPFGPDWQDEVKFTIKAESIEILVQSKTDNMVYRATNDDVFVVIQLPHKNYNAGDIDVIISENEWIIDDLIVTGAGKCTPGTTPCKVGDLTRIGGADFVIKDIIELEDGYCEYVYYGWIANTKASCL